MENSNKLVFRLEGPAENDHHLGLSVFAEKIKQFDAFLKSSAKDSGENNATFDIVKLSHSSPVAVECVPSNAASPATVFLRIWKNLDAVRYPYENERRQFIDDVGFLQYLWAPLDSHQNGNKQTSPLTPKTLDALEKLARPPRGCQITNMEIQVIFEWEEEVYQLDEDFREYLYTVRKIVERMKRSIKERMISTIDGKLEQINIHGNQNTFQLYPNLPNSAAIECQFSDQLLDEVQQALGCFVSVRGECFHHPDTDFVHKIQVQEITVMPSSDKLPSLRDLYGIAPDATGDQTAEEFVRQLRDKWN